MSSTELKEAYSSIKGGDKVTARSILRPYVKENPQDANGWWLLAHAIDDTDQRKRSLQRVLKLDPDFAPARRELDKLDKLAERDDDFLQDLSFSSDTSGGSKAKNKKNAKGSGSKTEIIIGSVLIGIGLIVLVCGGIFYAVSQATTSVIDEIAQSVTLEANTSSGSGNVQVSSGSGGGGLYDEHFWDVIDKGSINTGQTVNGTVDTFDDDGWTFEGRAGQTVTIEANATDGILDTELFLYAPGGTLLDENDDINFLDGDTDSRITFTLPEDGTYGIVVSAFGTGGDYQLSVR